MSIYFYYSNSSNIGNNGHTVFGFYDLRSQLQLKRNWDLGSLISSPSSSSAIKMTLLVFILKSVIWEIYLRYFFANSVLLRPRKKFFFSPFKPSGLFPFKISFWHYESYGKLAGLLGQDNDPSQNLFQHRITECRKKPSCISILWVRFEPTIPVFERPTTISALDRTATAIGTWNVTAKRKKNNLDI
jgi:hypothetical protein